MPMVDVDFLISTLVSPHSHQYQPRVVTKQRCQTKGHPLFYEEFRPVNEFHELIPTVLPVVLAKMIAPYCAPNGGTYPMAGQLVPHVFEPDCDIRAVQLRCFHQSLMFRLSFGGANNPCTNMFHCRQCALGTIRRRNGDLHLAQS